MSCVIVLAPVVIAAWPVLAAAILAATGAAGFKVLKQEKKVAAARQSVELEVEEAEVVADSMRMDQELSVEKDGVKVTFSRDARGRFKTCVEGEGRSKEELRAIGEDLSGRVIQQYVHRRLAQELKEKGFTTVSEDVGADEAIRIHVRRYEG